jgi:ribosomal protein S18 acetylase RimI-like enzyme
MTAIVRPMLAADVPAACAVSRDAGELFRTVAEPRIAARADDPPFTPEELAPYVDAGRAWVATDGGTVVGLAVATVIGGDAHLEEVDVARAAGRRGHGSRLVETVAEWARAAGLAGVTLTTFRDVPWNAPWYARLGFEVVAGEALTPALRELCADEAARGLAPELRVVMRRAVPAYEPVASLPGQETLVASWQALARLSPGARVTASSAGVAAVFPGWEPLNNAIAAPPYGHDALVAKARAVEQLFAEAGVGAWALWIASCAPTFDARDATPAVGTLRRDTTTLVMRATLTPERRSHDDVAEQLVRRHAVVETSVDTAVRADGGEAIPASRLGVPDGVPGLSAWVYVHEDRAVAGASRFLHGDDAGIYAVGTRPEWRRRGFARALVEHALHDAYRRGARTATLQSTPMGAPLYAGLGFRPAGRYEEWVPDRPAGAAS